MLIVSIAISLFLAGLVLMILNPVASLMTLALLLPFDRALEIAGITIFTNEAYLAGLALGFLGVLIIRRISAQVVLKFTWPMLPFLLAVAATVLVAQHRADVFKQFLRWSEFFLVVAAVYFGLRDKRDFNRLLTALLISGIVASAIGLLQHFLGINMTQATGHAPAAIDQMNQVKGVVRAYSTFGHPNQFAGFLILLVPLAFEVFLENKQVKWQFLMGLVTLTLALALTMTYSRGGWISAISAVLIIIMYYIPRNLIKSMALFLVFVCLLFILPFYLNKLNTRFASITQIKEDTAISGRLFYQKLALQMIQEKPLLGCGAGNYKYAIKKYTDKYPGEGIYLEKHIHNLYSQIAVETGLLGLAMFMFFLGYSFWSLMHRFRMLPRPRDRAMIVAVSASFFAFLLHNNFDVLMIYARGIHFGMVLGMGLALKSIAAAVQPFSKLEVPNSRF